MNRREFLKSATWCGGIFVLSLFGFRNIIDYFSRPEQGIRLAYKGTINNKKVEFYTFDGSDRRTTPWSLMDTEADVLKLYGEKDVEKEFWDFDGKGVIGDNEFDKIVIPPTKEVLTRDRYTDPSTGIEYRADSNSQIDKAVMSIVRKRLEEGTKEYQFYLSQILAQPITIPLLIQSI